MAFTGLACALGLALGCAQLSATDDRAARAEPPGPAIQALIADDLAFGFSDPGSPGLTSFESVGPWRVLSVDEDSVELEGFDPLRHEATRATLRLHGNAVWARVEIAGREFLTRLR